MDREIPFMDLGRQYREHKKEFLDAVEKVCEETAFSGGKYVKEFEQSFQEYLGAKYSAGVGSGTDALFLAVKALGIGPGDEVIIPANTFIASAWGAVHAGAEPVFVDCTPDTWEIDASKIEEKITEKTKAVVGVHLYGQPFDFDGVKKIADRHHLYVIEDCAQAHGAEYKGKKAGTLGDIGCFSFYPGKNLGAFGEAGAVVSDNKQYIDEVNRLKDHGALRKYHHDVVGYNMRMDGIQGAVLSVKLKYLDGWNEKRRRIAARYRAEIKNPAITFQSVPPFVLPVCHLFEVQAKHAEDFIAYLQEKGIRCGRHYPLPCHLQKAFHGLGYKKGDCPQAEKLAENCVSLPMFPELTEEEISYVIDCCNGYTE